MSSPNPNAHDDAIAARLDEVSRQLVGLGVDLAIEEAKRAQTTWREG